MTFRARLIFVLLAAVPTASCGSTCGLGIHGRSSASGNVPCCGNFVFRDFPLPGSNDPEFDLASTSLPSQPGIVDAFLVPTSCAKLFDGPYPGATALCQVYVGPAAPGKVSSRVSLPAGTYRLWLQGYTSNTSDAPYLVDIDIWDHSCLSPLQ